MQAVFLQDGQCDCCIVRISIVERYTSGSNRQVSFLQGLYRSRKRYDVEAGRKLRDLPIEAFSIILFRKQRVRARYNAVKYQRRQPAAPAAGGKQGQESTAG